MKPNSKDLNSLNYITCFCNAREIDIKCREGNGIDIGNRKPREGQYQSIEDYKETSGIQNREETLRWMKKDIDDKTESITREGGKCDKMPNK